MRIGLLGTRGIPANYSGFETFAEELSVRLAARGHDVTVYCRSHHTPRGLTEYRGVRLRVLPTLRTKHLDTPAHTLISALDAGCRRFDVVLVCNAANAALLPLLRGRGAAVAINVDGLEWRRRKWGALARGVHRISERLAGRLSDVVVTDARVVQAYYRETYGIDSAYVAYGAPDAPVTTTAALSRFGLERRRYFLYVGRLEPENNADRVVAAFERVDTDLRLVIVGDAPYARDYIARVRATRDPRIVFTGYVFGEGYRELVSHAYASIHATEAGGTHPALLEAMGMGRGVLVNDVAENREAAGDTVLYFRAGTPGDLEDRLREALASPDRLDHLAEQARRRVRAEYNWEAVVDGYEEIFDRLRAPRAVAARRLAAFAERSSEKG
jgi:glycosyltransferase involved in cell wall biosynthesis